MARWRLIKRKESKQKQEAAELVTKNKEMWMSGEMKTE